MVGTRVLVTGTSGLLGKYLMAYSPRIYNTCGTWHHHPQATGHNLDLAYQASVDAVFEKVQPQVIIHCAAIGSVDYCENHFEEAHDINVRGVKRMLVASRRYKAKFIFISSNAVFAGTMPPYGEEDERFPVNTYGRLKKHAEDAVFQYAYDWLVIRPILLYGNPLREGRGNWATRVIDSLSNGHMLYVVKDVNTQPTYAADLAAMIWELLPCEMGIYHVASEEAMTLFDFAMAVADVWTRTKVNVENRILPTSSSKFKDLASRPADTTYKLDKLRSFCEQKKVPMPCGVQEGLVRMFCEL